MSHPYPPSLPPSLNTEPYPFISADRIGRVNEGKVAVVTGAARGIGAAISLSLARTGATLALLDFTVERLTATKEACEAQGVKVYGYACDVTEQSRCVEVFGRIERDVGDVDILVNNAGRNSRRPISMESFDEFWKGVEVNLKGAMICTFQVLPQMRKRRSGCIINIASRAGTVSMPFAAAYSTGKAGLIHATACIQSELEADGFGDCIGIYALHPGAVRTDMTVPIDADVAAQYPQVAAKWAGFHKVFKVNPSLCGQTCAFFTTGKAKALRGKYFDCEQDIETVLKAAAGAKDVLDGLYELKVDFLNGLKNDGGTANFG